MLFSLFLLLFGLLVLTLGAHGLVWGAARLALAAGLSPLVIGLTVVAFGTSAPELAVSLKSGLSGHADMAVGNAVGSSIFNTLLILGGSALVVPLAITKRLVRLDIPIMILVSAAALGFSLDGSFSRLESTCFFTAFLAYVGLQVWLGKTEARPQNMSKDQAAITRPRGIGLVLAAVAVLAGLFCLVLGSQFMVDGASDLARTLGMSELVIGLTIVAVGTSLPEMATSIVAALKGERDIAVGNVVGSNIFNILAALGATGMIAPSGLAVSPHIARFDLPVMFVAAALCLPICRTGAVISRLEGAFFISLYVGYTVFLIFRA
ncbi:MAG: calcium/sodium antiporter [Thermodesulfobacteriota bacterium]|nr:calcium/sodium antiporter [Thermodesulfobacteriota bacterium]